MLPSTQVECPYCGEPIDLLVDDSAGDQQYIEDCQVCCRPILVTIYVDETDDSGAGGMRVVVAAEDDA